MGQLNFKKLFEFHCFSEIFYCSMKRLRNTNLGVFMQCNKKKLESNHHLNKQKLNVTSSINQLVIR